MVIDFSSFYEMPSDLDRLFAEVLRGPGLAQRRAAYPLINVYESEDSYHVDICAPGVAADDMELTMEARSLIIKGERRSPEGRYFRQERIGGSFQRIISLNTPVDRERVTARSTDGILRITLPKTEDVRPRRIPIAS